MFLCSPVFYNNYLAD